VSAKGRYGAECGDRRLLGWPARPVRQQPDRSTHLYSDRIWARFPGKRPADKPAADVGVMVDRPAGGMQRRRDRAPTFHQIMSTRCGSAVSADRTPRPTFTLLADRRGAA